MKKTEHSSELNRRLGSENSETRQALLDAAELLMQEEGYGALSSRRVAERAGLKQQLVYYYFHTMDDLLLAVFRRRTERGFDYINTLLEKPQPLHQLWKTLMKQGRGVLTAEFMALAHHNKAIGAEIAQSAQKIRRLEMALLARALETSGIKSELYSPAVLSILMLTLSQALTRERALGISLGHREMNAVIKHFLELLEPSEQ